MIQMTDEGIKLADALETAEADYLYTRIKLTSDLPGKPHAVAVRRDGPLRSIRVAANASPMNNRICGLHAGKDTLPPDLLAWFEDVGLTPGIPVIGTQEETAGIARRYAAAPMSRWTHAQMVTETAELPFTEPAHPAHPARRLECSEMDAFAEIHADVFGPRGEGRDLPRDMFRALVESGRAEAYAVDGDEGGIGGIGLIFYAGNGVAYLATAATVRSMRGRGYHSALIARRIEAARERQCRYVAATALPTSRSRRNLKRAGFRRSHIQTMLRPA